jgi:hypothetical protein
MLYFYGKLFDFCPIIQAIFTMEEHDDGVASTPLK